MRKLAVSFLISSAVLGQGASADTPILTFDEVRVGSVGTGRTVFHGTEIETFDVEILGKLPNVGAGQNLILGRCSGGPLERTGVLAGMSGSPVTVDGKLVGAIAFSWGFSKEPIAGITPIEEMLSIARLDTEPRTSRVGSIDRRGKWLERLHSPDLLAAFFGERLRSLVPATGSAMRLPVPLSVAGIGPSGLARILPDLSLAGFSPVQVGGSGSSPSPSPRLEPGSAVGLKLVRGDLEMTATGTVTWVEGDELLAFGHSIFGLGRIDLPLTGAAVQLLLPNLRQSSRIAVPLSEVGALREDRARGVYGRIGATPRMIPVRLQLERPGGPERTFSFDIADDALLSPLLLYVSLNGVLAGTERVFGDATLRLREGSVIKMLDGEDVEVDNVFAGPTAFLYGTGLAAYILHVLMNNAWVPPQIAGVNLILEYDEWPRTARVRRATLDRYRVRPGETLEITVILAPYRGHDQHLKGRIEIPAETPPGKLTLHVGGALDMVRAEDGAEPLLPRDLDQLIRLINQLRRNDRVYILASRDDSGVLLDGARLPNLPPSVASLLSGPGAGGRRVMMGRRSVVEEMLPTDYAVEGALVLEIEVEPW